MNSCASYKVIGPKFVLEFLQMNYFVGESVIGVESFFEQMGFSSY